MPLSGSRSEPLADANAIAGESRPGSCRAASVFFCSGLSVPACAAARGRGRDLAFHAGNQLFQVVRLAGQLDRPGALAFERLFGLGLFALALRNEHGHPYSFLRKCGEITTERVPFGSYFGPYSYELGKIGDQRIDLDLHVGQHGAEQDGGAHRLERVLGAHHQGGRRPAADALERGQHLGDHGAAARERAFDRVLVGRKRREPALGGSDLVLHAADRWRPSRSAAH